MFWTGVHMVSMLIGVVWMVSSATLDVTKRGSRLRRIAWPVFSYGRPFMYLATFATLLSSAMRHDTWEFMIPLLFGINLYLAHMFKSKETYSV